MAAAVSDGPRLSTLSSLSRIIVAALDKIVKNASWRKHGKLVQDCKVVLEKLTSFVPSEGAESPLFDGPKRISAHDAEFMLQPLLSACDLQSQKVVEPAIDCFEKLMLQGHLVGEVGTGNELQSESSLIIRVLEAVCKCHETGDEAIELLVLKTLLTAVISPSLGVHGDYLLKAINTCYNIFLVSKANQAAAKATLTQMLIVVFKRMEADSVAVLLQPVVVDEVNEEPEKSGPEAFVQNLFKQVAQDIDGVVHIGTKSAVQNDDAFTTTVAAEDSVVDELEAASSSDKHSNEEVRMYKNALARKSEIEVREPDKDLKDDPELGNKFRRDGYLVFRGLCKLSMRATPQEGPPGPSLRAKILGLELLKVVLDNAGPFFCTNARFLAAIKRHLCLSVLQNCAASHILSVFQMSCSIFLSLMTKFRAPLKTEIGVFFPMIILRVIENVAQPNYQQKMTVLCFIEKLAEDPQILADTFVNYDCDAESYNIFERIVNCLLKSAQGPPPGADTGLNAAQDATLKLYAMKCLVRILKAMGDWMDKQLTFATTPSVKSSDTETTVKSEASTGAALDAGEEAAEGMEGSAVEAAGGESAITIEQRRVQKLELGEGIRLFNQKPGKGIDFLVKAKRIQKTPEEVAKFLLSATGLNKGMIGDYLGDKEEFALKVMHAYTDSFDFKDMEFDEAIRTLLMGFRLPGEAQKIDRIMEKFAERYCICNPKAFTSADTAYVLAYSVIMLNTDAHNVMVKDKMSKAAFIKNNRGINDGQDLPEEFMGALYDRIVQKEIKLKADVAPAAAKSGAKDNKFPPGIDNILNIVIRKSKEEKLFESSEDAIRYMQEQLKEKAEKPQSAYFAATDVEIVKPMVEVSWAPMLAGFSVPLDKSEDESVTMTCLEGFKHAIHITAVMRMQTQRDAFITSLAKFTSLHSPADIKERNVNAIQVMITIGEEYGNHLEDAWEHVLTCISRFDQLHLIGEGALPDATFFSNDPDKKLSSNPKKKGRLHFAALAARRGSYEGTQARGPPLPGAVTPEQISNLVSHLSVLGQVDTNQMNKIFTGSQALSSDAIVHFVEALCKVSLDELRSPTDPRVFSLTKIVEISHFNMNRIRLVWSKMWNSLSDYFVTVGCSGNLSVAMYAMDSLRQLAMKFMDRDELANYNFQNQFMRPFVIIMQQSQSIETREFIIRCVSQMVCTRVGSVKSGWKITFLVFTIAAADENAPIVHLAFETVEKIVRNYFQHITETETTIFTDCVNCLLAFMSNKLNDDISLNAIAFLRFCALKLGEGELGGSSETSEANSNTDAAAEATEIRSRPDKDDHLFFWFPLLSGLAEMTFDSRPAIRKSAAHVLFDVLQCHGHLYTSNSWERILDTVLFPLYDYEHRAVKLARTSASEEEANAWLYQACSLTLQLLVDLFAQYFRVVSSFLHKLLALMGGFIRKKHENLAAITVAGYARLIVKAGPQFSKEHWLESLQTLQAVLKETFPNAMQIVAFAERESQASTEKEFITQYQSLISELKYYTTVQMLLVQAVKEIYDAFGSRMAPAYVMQLLAILNAIVGHSHRVNSDLNLRSKVRSLQLKTQMTDPPLLRLESDSSHVYMDILQRLHVENPAILKNADVEARFVDFCEEVLKVYLDISSSREHSGVLQRFWVIPVSSSKKMELVARAPLVVMTLKAVTKFKGTSFQKYITRFFPLLTGLIGCEHGSVEVQAALSDLFATCIGPSFIKRPAAVAGK